MMWEIVDCLGALLVILVLSLVAVWLIYAIITVLLWIIGAFK